jgi:ABC-type transport system involved in multi-copper enzyme maturation permease subunit
MGRFMFHSVLLLLMTAIILVVPGVAAPSIVGERERQTFQILQVTQMSPWQLVLGKLSASMSFAIMLLIATGPVAAIPLLFGGVAIGDVAAALGMLILTAVMLASIGTWMSSRSSSTRAAVAMSYLIAFTLAFLTFASLGAEILVYSNLGRDDPFRGDGRELFSVLPNPYVGLVSAVQHPLDQAVLTSDTPFVPIEFLLYARDGNDIGGFGGPADARRADQRAPVWIYTVLIYVGLTAFSLQRASINVRAPSTRIRKMKRLKGVDE